MIFINFITTPEREFFYFYAVDMRNLNHQSFIKRMKVLEKTYLGFPNNLKYDYSAVQNTTSVYINNCGDPFSTVAWKKHSKHFEQEVLKYFFNLYKASVDEAWGYMTSGGTEGNMEGLLLAREKYPDSVLYFSEDTHYSIEKIANLLKIEYEKIPSIQNGEIDYELFGNALLKHKGRPAIVNVNCGTTIKEAHDDLVKITYVLDKYDIKEKYIHVDAALAGMTLPFIEDSPKYDFEQGIDSIAISMHKFLGCPIMSGIVLAKKSAVAHIMKKIEYVNSHDTTILGSRNGQAPVYVWYILQKHGSIDIKNDVLKSVENAKYLNQKLRNIGFGSNLNQNSITVYFDKPHKLVVDKWQLACYGDIAHAVIMPHVTKSMLDNFIEDIVMYGSEYETAKSFSKKALKTIVDEFETNLID